MQSLCFKNYSPFCWSIGLPFHAIYIGFLQLHTHGVTILWSMSNCLINMFQVTDDSLHYKSTSI